MNKQDFLQALKDGLNFLSPKELQDAIAEFEEHFEVGVERGKTEQELVDQLGDPRRIIEAYRNEALERGNLHIEKGTPEREEKQEPRQEEPRPTSSGSLTSYISIHESYKESDVLAIEISVADSDVDFTLTDEAEVRVDIDGMSGCDIRVELRNGKLQIVQEFRFFRLFNWRKEPKIKVSIPRLYEGGLDISTASGDIELPGFKGYKLRIRTVSGDLELGDLYAKSKIEINTTSGDISMGKSMAESVTIQSTSGDMKMDALTTNELLISGVSSDIEQRRNCFWEAKQLEVRTVSGDIKLALNDHWQQMKFNTVSGDIKLILPEESERFEVRLESVSGKVKSHFGSDPRSGRLIKAKTISGDLKIEKG